MSSTEETALIPDTQARLDNVERNSNGVTFSPDTNEDSSGRDAELEQPWPATYSRSISLLVGPTMRTSTVKEMMRSPMAGGVAKVRGNLRNLQRGYATPDPPKQRVIPEHNFTMGIEKVQSLDFNQPVSGETQIEQPKASLAVSSTAVKENTSNSAVPGATTGQSLFNMINSLLGVGILGTPYIFKSTGWIGGFAVTLIFALIAWRTATLVGRELNGDSRPVWMFDGNTYKSTGSTNAHQIRRMYKPLTSFPDIARTAFGPKINITLSSFLYFELFSCLCIFFISLGDHLNTLFPSISKQKLMVYSAFALLVPTTLLRTPRLLSYLSAVGIASTVVVVLSVFAGVFYFGSIAEEISETMHQDNTSEEYYTLWNISGLPIGFGIIGFTFSGHALVPSIFTAMDRPQDFEKLINMSFVVCVVCCLIVALSGYYIFGSTVDDQITVSLEKASGGDNSAISAVTWLMILTSFSKFTLTSCPISLGLEELIAPYVTSEKYMEYVSSLVKVGLIAMSLGVAIFVPSFGFLCSLLGLICAMTVSVIFPAASHLKMFGTKLSSFEKTIDWIIIIFGIITAVAGTIALI